MAGKKNTTRTATIDDRAKLAKQIARIAKAWGWKEEETADYCLRMGVNRVLSLERHRKVLAGRQAARRGRK